MGDEASVERLWEPGDLVWLRMGDATYPARITAVADYCDMHSDGYECQQYYAVVTFPREVVEDALISHCMIVGGVRTRDYLDSMGFP